jgi:hypothetical protein
MLDPIQVFQRELAAQRLDRNFARALHRGAAVHEQDDLLAGKTLEIAIYIITGRHLLAVHGK